MEIRNSKVEDIADIFKLYGMARDFQKIKGAVLWPSFDSTLVEREIAEKHQWKIVQDGEIACVWATTFDDPLIWKDKNADPSIYIHRIATNTAFRGQYFVGTIVAWAKEYAKANNKGFIRLDTVGNNPGLIDYYQKNGFEFLGLVKLEANPNLPEHYHNADVCLFEFALNKEYHQ